jgi:1,6-anhydro-N-acetylmuramate kinase
VTSTRRPQTVERAGPPPLPHAVEPLVIGLESGSSGDGIDAALVAIKGSCETASIELRHFAYVPFHDETRQRMLELFDFETPTLDKLCVMHAILGELFAEAALLVCEEHGRRSRRSSASTFGDRWPDTDRPF